MGLFNKAKAMMAVAAASLASFRDKGNAPLKPIDYVRWMFPRGIGEYSSKMTPQEWIRNWASFGTRPAPNREPEHGLRYDQVQRRNAVPKFRSVNYAKEARRRARAYRKGVVQFTNKVTA